VLKDYRVVSLKDVGIDSSVDEIADSVEERALGKALAYAAQSGCVTLSQDTGLEIPALGLAPGSDLTTWAGEFAERLSEEGLRRIAIERLRAVNDRRGSFVSAVALADPSGAHEVFSHRTEGTFDLDRTGNAPVPGHAFSGFFVSAGNGKTWAEMTDEERMERDGTMIAAVKAALAAWADPEDH
jgi:XTP/dITP diphosphohydrolase